MIKIVSYVGFCRENYLYIKLLFLHFVGNGFPALTTKGKWTSVCSLSFRNVLV